MLKEEKKKDLLRSDQIISVTTFTRELKKLLEGGVMPRWIRGEVSNLRRQSSGHVYFTLKDAGSQLTCVLFRGNAMQQQAVLKDGVQLLVYGEVSVYEPRGAYQLIVRLVMEDGKGRLQAAFEALKERLATEGLFDADKKRKLPPLPKVIGFITSPTGAAVQDFISILKRRGWRGRLVVLPSQVQGNDAPGEMIEQLRRVEALGWFDLLVVGRGGGNLEDLWPFNDEGFVRALGRCSVPVISAVGHEIDFTLSDFVADYRAETPSAAAEMITSLYLNGVEKLDRLAERLERMIPRKYLEFMSLRLDELGGRLLAGVKEPFYAMREQLSSTENRLLGASPEMKIRLMKERLEHLEKRLSQGSIQEALNRGFAAVKDAQGLYIKHREGLKAGNRLDIELRDGSVGVEVL